MSPNDQPQPFHRKNKNLEAFTDIKIETKRMHLIALEQSFAPEIFKEFTSEITRYMFPVSAKDITETRTFISQTTTNMKKETQLVLAATGKSSGEFLGCVGLHGKLDPTMPDLGLWFKKSVHGKGYGLEAISALKKWSENNLNVRAFLYPVDRNNIPSRKIPERLGGVIVKEIPNSPTMDPGKFLDEIVFKIPAT